MSEENNGYFERIVSQDITICPNCKGSGALRATNPNGTPRLHMGKPIVQTCPVCLGDGRMGRIVKEEYYRMPGTEMNGGEPRTLLQKIVDRLKIR